MSLVGKKAPLFSANAVVNGNDIVENFSLEQFIGDKYVVFFFYPLDFTFVCPTEIIAFQDKLTEFEIEMIRQALESQNGVVSHAADLLSMRRTTLVEKMKKYGLNK